MKILLFLVLSYPLVLTAQSLQVVKNGQANASIVIDSAVSIDVKNAAKVLQNYVQQSTGALLPITNFAGNNISIRIGQSSFLKSHNIDISTLDEDGFIIQGAGSRNYIIVGGSDGGTEYGVYEFLERYLGVCWLMPTYTWTDIPNRSNLTIPAVRIIENPVYLSRSVSLSSAAYEPYSTWSNFNRFRSRINFHHNLANLIPPSKYSKTNPEFYFTEDHHIPNADNDKNWQLDFSAKGIVDSAAAQIIRFFKNNPRTSSYSLGMNDSKAFSRSSMSSPIRNKIGYISLSDDYFSWVNQVVNKVKEVFPDKKFGVLAYNNLLEPPVNVRVHPSVVPFITYERMRWADKDLEKMGKEITDEWASQVKEVGWYDYDYGYSYLLPRVWFHVMRDYLVWGSSHQVKHYYAEFYPNWGEGPKGWIISKLLWNPNRNVDSLLQVWYDHAVGKAASPYLAQFYSIWETFWTADIYKNNSKWNVKTGQWLNFHNPAYLMDVPAGYVAKCDVLLRKADSLTVTAVQKNRLHELMQMWTFYKACIISFQATDNTTEKEINNRISLIPLLRKDSLFVNSIDIILADQKNILNKSWGSNINNR
jgi:hypothetical protein